MLLGEMDVNINFMSVAPLSEASELSSVTTMEPHEEGQREALMILGVDKEVRPDVVARLKEVRGILAVTIVTL